MQRYGIPAPNASPITTLAERYGVAGLGPAPAKDARRFDLDFPGGTPEDLIVFLRERAGESVNAIIPDDVANTQIPAMSLRNVTLAQLFEAIEAASRRTVVYAGGITSIGSRPGPVQYQRIETSYGFQTVGEPGDNAIWHFYREDPPEMPQPKPPRAVRFHQLGSYLDTFNVEDITTAIRTGWDLLEAGDQPKLKFHEETKLLIAVGNPALLETIDDVLAQLKDGLASGIPTTRRAPPTPSAPPPRARPAFPAQ